MLIKFARFWAALCSVFVLFALPVIYYIKTSKIAAGQIEAWDVSTPLGVLVVIAIVLLSTWFLSATRKEYEDEDK